MRLRGGKWINKGWRPYGLCIPIYLMEASDGEWVTEKAMGMNFTDGSIP